MKKHFASTIFHYGVILLVLLAATPEASGQTRLPRKAVRLDLLQSIGIQTTIQDFDPQDASTFLSPGFTLGMGSLVAEPVRGLVLRAGAELHSKRVAGPLSRQTVWSFGLPLTVGYLSPGGYGIMVGVEKELYPGASKKEGSLGAPLPPYDINLTVHTRFIGLTGKYYPGNGMATLGLEFIF